MLFKLIEEFNKDLLGINRPTPQLLEQKESDWLIGALKEEIDEFETVEHLHEKADALVDLIYFAVGGLTRMGIDHYKARRIFSVVHEANMQKVKGKKEGRAVQSELDASKPAGWIAPDEKIKNIIFGEDI